MQILVPGEARARVPVYVVFVKCSRYSGVSCARARARYKGRELFAEVPCGRDDYYTAALLAWEEIKKKAGALTEDFLGEMGRADAV